MESSGFIAMSSSETSGVQISGGNQEHDSSDNHANDGVDGIIELGRYGSSCTAKQRRSKVWDHFNVVVVDGCDKAVCIHCNAHLVTGNRNGTSHLKDHTKSCPELQNSRKRKSTPKPELPVFDQQRSREDFAKMIVCHNYSFCMSEHYYTRQFIYNLQPLFKLVHRTVVKEDIIKLYKEEKLRRYEILDRNMSYIRRIS